MGWVWGTVNISSSTLSQYMYIKALLHTHTRNVSIKYTKLSALTIRQVMRETMMMCCCALFLQERWNTVAGALKEQLFWNSLRPRPARFNYLFIIVPHACAFNPHLIHIYYNLAEYNLVDTITVPKRTWSIYEFIEKL